MRTEVFAFIGGVTLVLICATALEHLSSPPACPPAAVKSATGSRSEGALLNAATSAPTGSASSAISPAASKSRAAAPATQLGTDEPEATDAPIASPSSSSSSGSGSANTAKAFGSGITSKPVTIGSKMDKPVEAGMLATEVNADAALDVTVWFLGTSAAEVRFLTNDLIPKAVGGKVTLRPLTLIEKWKPHLPENIITDPNQANILIVSGAMEEKTCNNGVVSKCAYLTPALSIVVSDEIGSAKCVERKLSDMTPTVMRQFADEAFDRKRLFNVNTMPLGYGFDEAAYKSLPERASVTKASDRQVTWTFVGHRKMDRESMAGKLDAAFPKNEFHETLEGDALVQAYTKAAFAPSTAGSVSLERARLYEASRMGAIPVVVGHQSVIGKTFGHFVGMDGELPPWVIADTWDDAIAAMKALVEAPAKLDEKQQAVMKWWAKAYDSAAGRIRLAIEADYLRRQTMASLGQQWKARGRDDVASRFLKPVMPWAGMADLTVYDEAKAKPPAAPSRGRAVQPVRPPGPVRRNGQQNP